MMVEFVFFFSEHILHSKTELLSLLLLNEVFFMYSKFMSFVIYIFDKYKCILGLAKFCRLTFYFVSAVFQKAGILFSVKRSNWFPFMDRAFCFLLF